MKAEVKTQSGLLKFDMARPCADCPFRTDTPCALSPDNAESAIDGIVLGGEAFACHKTVEYSVPDAYIGGRCTERTQHCAGAMIFLEKIGEPTLMMTRAKKMGLYDPSGLDQGAPVVSSVLEFLRGQDKARKREE